MTSNEPLFRAPKGTPNFNAYRTLAMGVVGALGVMVLTDPAMRLWDKAVRDVPWVSSTLQVSAAAEPFGAVVNDQTVAEWPVGGTRRVWIEDTSGRRICNTERHDSWEGSSGSTWTVQAFTGGCPVPAQPFRVCTKFIVETSRGVPGAFGPYCSELFDPGAD